MTKEQQPVQENQPEHEKRVKPRYANRRERRKFLGTIFNNDRTPKNSGFIQMSGGYECNPIYFPKHEKLKGYQKK